MIRLKGAKDSAVTARTQAVNQMKALVSSRRAEACVSLQSPSLHVHFRVVWSRRRRSIALACRHNSMGGPGVASLQLIQSGSIALVNAFGIGPESCSGSDRCTGGT